METPSRPTIYSALTSDYRYAFAYGLLKGKIDTLDLELRFATNAQLSKSCRQLIAEYNNIETQLKAEEARRAGRAPVGAAV